MVLFIINAVYLFNINNNIKYDERTRPAEQARLKILLEYATVTCTVIYIAICKTLPNHNTTFYQRI